MCTISPILNQVMAEPRIHVLTMSEVKEVDGRPGDYMLTVYQRPRYVDNEKCTGCSACALSQVPLESGLIVKEGLVDRISIDPRSASLRGLRQEMQVRGIGTIGKGR